MNKDVIEIRELMRQSGLGRERFADAIGISLRQLDRITSKDCKEVKLKELNSARWVVSQRKKTA